VLYLPPYSPNLLDPIEGAFSKLKRPSLRVEARSRKGFVVAAVGAAPSEVTARDTKGFFEHCGYR
jgi:transposase